MQSIQNFVPAQLPARLVSEFEERLHTRGPDGEESIAVRLWEDRPIDSESIELLGKVLEPHRREKNGINGMVRDVATIMDDLYGLCAKLKRYYVAGDYSRKTGVLHFSATHLIGDVSFGSMEEMDILNKMYAHLKKTYDQRRKLKDTVEVNVCEVQLQGKRIQISNANYTISFVIANLDHLGSVGREKGHGATVIEVHNAFERYAQFGSHDLGQLVNLIQEPHDRYVDRLSPQWHAFIRASKFLLSLILPPLLPQDALETLCIKALLKQNQYHGKVDLEAAFGLVVNALKDPAELASLNSVSCPEWAFQQDVFEKSIPQPPVSAPRGEGAAVHHLLLPGHALWTPRPAEMEILTSILTPLPPKLRFSHIAACRDPAPKDAEKAPPGGRGLLASALIRSFRYALFLTLCLSVALILLMEAPNGTMPSQHFITVAQAGEDAALRATAAVLRRGGQPLLDSAAFDVLERGWEAALKGVEDFPALWQMGVPLGIRKAVVATRDHYGAGGKAYAEWGMDRLRPHLITIRKAIDGYL